MLSYLEPSYLAWELGDIPRARLALSVGLGLEPGATTEIAQQRRSLKQCDKC